MKDNLTELVFILDKSGSMEGREKDVIGGFNSMLKKQKEVEGEVKVTTVLFSTYDTILYYRRSMELVPEMTLSDYIVGGGTALLDCFGKMIDRIGEVLSNTSENDRPSKVVFVIMTDGEENSSKQYNQLQIKQMVEMQKNVYSWDFIYMGADIDAFEIEEMYGIRVQECCEISLGCYDDNFIAVNKAVSSLRKDKKLCVDWADNLQKAN